MPCDDNNLNTDDKYCDVLRDIETFIALRSDIDNVIIGGDLNTDTSRARSSHTRALNDFCINSDMSLCFKHDVARVDYMYESPGGSKSMIDHILLCRMVCHMTETIYPTMNLLHCIWT